MKLKLISSQNVLQLIEIFKIIKSLDSYCTLLCQDDYVHIQTMDSSHVCLLDIKIMKEWFESYESKNEIISFHSSIIVKILNLYIPKTELILESVNEETLNIELIYPDNIEKLFKIPLIDIDKETFDTQDNDYSMEITMNTKVLDKYINELMIFGDILEIQCKNDNVYMKSNGTEGHYNIKIPHDNLEEFVVEENLKLRAKVDSRYVSYISKLYCVFKTINIKVDSQFPMRFYFDESYCINKKEETSTNNLQITYYIAPKIDDDEDENEQDSDEDNLLNNIEEENEIIE